MSDNSNGRDPILDAITESLRDFVGVDETPMVVGYIVAAEWIDNTGEKHLFGDSMQDQRRTSTLGLTSWFDTIEKGRAMREDAADD